ncbi:MAG: thioredoxin-dependent thiol peroxidase [Bacteroidales bacterium]
MTHLKVGDKIPEFSCPDQNGIIIHLKQFAGKKILLYFYPKDNTPGCTAEACNLRDNFTLLKKRGIEVIGVSTDSTKSHKSFETKFSLPFTLLADENKELVKAFGVWGEKKMYGKTFEGTLRTSFLIDEKGRVLKIFDKVDTRNHAEQVLKEINQ